MTKKVIVFLDALNPEETMGYLDETKQGKIKCNVPRVTPTVLGSVYTGTEPSKHQLVSPTPFNKQPVQRPQQRTVFEELSQDARVLSYLMPFTMNVNALNGLIAQSGVSGSVNVQQPALMIPRTPINMGKEDSEKALGSFIDYARILFSTVRELIRQDSSDIFFISFRNLDSFTHWNFTGDYRERLIKYIQYELREFEALGDDLDLMWFSDHGGCRANEVFRVNKWLEEKGFLETTVLERKAEQVKEQQDNAYDDQIDLKAPFVQVEKKSKFVCSDAFDSCIEVIRDDVTDRQVKELRNQLRSLDYYEEVYLAEELYGEEAKESDNIPRIIPDRKEGVLVSGNIYPEVPVKTEGLPTDEYDTVVCSRNGDHSPYGAFGANVDLRQKEEIAPEDLYYAIKKFCKDVTAKTGEAQMNLNAPIPHQGGVLGGG